MVLPPGHHREITQRRPFSGREKGTLGGVLAGLAALAVVLVIALAGPAHTTPRGCVDVTIVGATGAAAIHQCGANARALCRSAGKATRVRLETVREIQTACRNDGFTVG